MRDGSFFIANSQPQGYQHTESTLNFGDFVMTTHLSKLNLIRTAIAGTLGTASLFFMPALAHANADPDDRFEIARSSERPEPLKHVIALQLGLSAPLGGQAGLTYSPPIGISGRSTLFELQGNVGTLYYATSYEVGLRVSVPYVEFLYANVGYQWLGSSGKGEEFITQKINSQLAQEFEGQANTDDVRLKPGDVHFQMSGISVGAGFRIGVFRLEAGITKYNLYETIDRLADQIQARALELARSHLSGDQLAEAERHIRDSRAEISQEARKSLGQASAELHLAEETVPYVKIAVAIPLFRL